MKRLISTIWVLLIASNLLGQAWELASNKRGVTVYTRLETGSQVKAFRAEKEIQAPMEDILKILSDISTYTQWYDHCKSAEKLSIGENSFIYQMEFAMPFPFSNRYVVNEVIVTQTDSITFLDFQQVSGVKYYLEKAVRMPVSKGNWILTSTGPSTTYVSHQYLGDPAGHIPSGLINMLLVSGPINTLVQLEEFILSQ
ncbi:START domain-containing protein [Pontibacter sp. G13]|uniref:START domain-containing protein n=1 Tax=Pontibacter sp. G13 TaxID=3074898 RepID=UPI0028897761|nr:START domain-containing protein [Pontibacter sp. G13]WNJ17067.1 START domain-containing protein [Pontibacter sp. G13]